MINIVCNMMSYSPAKVHQCFREMYCVHLRFDLSYCLTTVYTWSSELRLRLSDYYKYCLQYDAIQPGESSSMFRRDVLRPSSFWFVLLFDPEDGDSKFIHNISGLLTDSTASHFRR
jgi:hypothetical protein